MNKNVKKPSNRKIPEYSLGTLEYTEYFVKTQNFIKEFDFNTKQYIEYSIVAKYIKDVINYSEKSNVVVMDDDVLKAIVRFMVDDYMKEYGDTFECNDWERDYFKEKATEIFEEEFNIKHIKSYYEDL